MPSLAGKDTRHRIFDAFTVRDSPKVKRMGGPSPSGTTEKQAAGGGPPAAPPKPYLFVVMHCDRPQAGGARYGLDGVDQVTIGRGSREATRRGSTLAIQLPGNTVSSAHARLLRD